MWGKHFESMYEGSMYGAGLAVFALWGYVISHVRLGRVELNPRKLADTLGGTMEEISKAIEFLMKPDPESRHKEHGGRRLLREGQFQYRVPSWQSYQLIRNEEDRREYNRLKQQEFRARKKGLPMQGSSIAALDRGDTESFEKGAVPMIDQKKDLLAATPVAPEEGEAFNGVI